MVEAVGRYRILELLGSGTLGSLYRARDTSLGRTVAVRIVSQAITANPAERERLMDRARRAAALSHPNIAALYESGQHGGLWYLATEFVAGQPLDAASAGQKLHPRAAVEFAIQMADALAEAHAAGLVHGNLDARRVLITAKGAAKILDFGFAEWTAGGSRVTATPPTERDDILALGLMLFTMLAGRPPASVRTLSAVDPSLPRELDPIVLKASSRNPDERHQSAASLAAELRSVAAILDVRQEAADAAEPAPSEHETKLRPIAWLLILLALGAVGWIVWVAARTT